MVVTDDVIAKCLEIEAKINFIMKRVENAEEPLWVAGDIDYAKFKSISKVQADAIVVLVGELQILTGS